MRGRSRIRTQAACLAATVAISVLATACGSSGSSTSSGAGGGAGHGKDYRITLVTGELKDPFYVSMAAGAKAEARQLGVSVSWQAPTAFDPSLEIPILSAVLASKPQFLIATPDDDKALIAPLRSFDQAGIPVMTVDTDVSDPTVRLGNVTSDNLLGGELAGKQLASVVGSGNVFLLCDPPGITTDDLRKQGFESAIRTYPKINYVGFQVYNGTDPTDAARVMNAELARVHNLSGVVACDGEAGLGAATALQSAGLAGKVKLISFDVSPDLTALLKSGTISALMIQQSYNIGSDAVRNAVAYLSGNHHAIPAELRLPYIIGTKANIDSPAITKFTGSAT